MATRNRFTNDGPPGRMLRCACGNAEFQYEILGEEVRLGLFLLTSDGPIHQVLANGQRPELKTHVQCTACDAEYDQHSPWDPSDR